MRKFIIIFFLLAFLISGAQRPLIPGVIASSIQTGPPPVEPTFVNQGNVHVSTQGGNVAFPASISAGNLLVLITVGKHQYPSATPSGFTLQSQSTGGDGIVALDQGNVWVTIWTKTAVGTETGNLTVSNTGGNSFAAQILNFSKASGTWNVAFSEGTDGSAGTSWSSTGDDAIAFRQNDVLVVVNGVNTDAYTASSHAFSASGITFGSITLQNAMTTTNGNDLSGFNWRATVSSGSGTVVPTSTMTLSGTGTGNPAGASCFIRIRID